VPLRDQILITVCNARAHSSDRNPSLPPPMRLPLLETSEEKAKLRYFMVDEGTMGTERAESIRYMTWFLAKSVGKICKRAWQEENVV
jgi:hypothetical protein